MIIERSYQAHREHWEKHLTEPAMRRRAESWLDDDTLDAWRHRRMPQALDRFLEHFRGAEWLTVGDGRWGLDARYIADRGGVALTTDVSEALLKESKARGLITNYRIANAESLPFDDQSFDFCFCKESFHHFPRPAVALYEMLRVARIAVVLVEPRDEYPPRPLTFLTILAKRMRGQPIDFRFNTFEDSGNYVYTVSERELEKIALGLMLSACVFKGLNTYYAPGVEYLKLSRRFASWRLRCAIGAQDLLSAMGLVRSGLPVAGIFKSQLSTTLQRALAASGFRVLQLPSNPYLPAQYGK